MISYENYTSHFLLFYCEYETFFDSLADEINTHIHTQNLLAKFRGNQGEPMSKSMSSLFLRSFSVKQVTEV